MKLVHISGPELLLSLQYSFVISEEILNNTVMEVIVSRYILSNALSDIGS